MIFSTGTKKILRLLHPFIFLQPGIQSTIILYRVFSKVVQCLYSMMINTIVLSLISKLLSIFYDLNFKQDDFLRSRVTLPYSRENVSVHEFLK